MRQLELLRLTVCAAVCVSCSSADAPRTSSPTDAAVPGKPDAGSVDVDASSPVPYDQWTWLSISDSKCASGATTGIAVNPHQGSKTLMLYFEGGGECYDAATCWGAKPAATNLSGYDTQTFVQAAQRKYPTFDRGMSDNPLRDSNMVFIPYCTGDLHIGTTEHDLQVDGKPKPTYFWGAKNIDLYLAQLVQRFADTEHVWMVGTSAGGFGIVLNFDRVARAFHVPTDMIDDSGPPITSKGATTNPLLKVWGYIAPDGCDTCSSYPNILHYDRTLQPNSRYAFLSFAEDTVISARLGYNLSDYPAVMDAFSNSLKDDPNAATYIVTNESSHVVETDPALAPQYMPWLTAMANGDASWKDTTYAKP